MITNVVCIDAGHGGANMGAVTREHTEKDTNARLALRLCKTLHARDILAVPTRFEDEAVSFGERGRVARRVGACLSLSLHCNWVTDPDVGGTEVYYWPGNERTEATAEAFKKALAVYGLPCRVVSALRAHGKWIEAPRTVLRAFPSDALLVEAFYLSSPTDVHAAATASWRRAFDSALAYAVGFHLEQLGA